MNRAHRIQSTRKDRGSQLVEFALVFVLLAMLVAGVWDLGRMFRGYISIANAARDGVRYAIRLPCIQSNENTRDAMNAAIVKAVTDELDGTRLPTPTIIVTPDVATNCPATKGSPITVTVSVPYQMWLGGITGLGITTLSAKAQMRWFGNDVR